MNDLSGTKELIFDTFLQLTGAYGYENVGVRAIAKKVGINPASIYHYFTGKKTMLKYAYDYYEEHRNQKGRPSDKMNDLLKKASAQEIVGLFACPPAAKDKKEYERMVLITKIIYMRMIQDPIANRLFAENKTDSLQFISSVLKQGMDIGRIDPNFDGETFAYVLIGSLEDMEIDAFSGAVEAEALPEREKRILAMLARLLATGLK